MDIKFIIKDTELQRVRDAILYIFPNTETQPKAGAKINPNTGTYNPEDYELKYTDNQWLKEFIRRWIVLQIKRAEQKKQQDQLLIQDTDNLIT